MKVQMLTMNDCPLCSKLKMLLKYALNDKYKDDIELINKEDDYEKFDKLISDYNLPSVPSLICGGEVLSKTDPSLVVAFLEKHLGKK